MYGSFSSNLAPKGASCLWVKRMVELMGGDRIELPTSWV